MNCIRIRGEGPRNLDRMWIRNKIKLDRLKSLDQKFELFRSFFQQEKQRDFSRSIF